MTPPIMPHDAPPPARTLTVLLQPENREILMPYVKTVLQLLAKLNIGPAAALVIRDGQLLTHDRRLNPGESITIRLVISSG